MVVLALSHSVSRDSDLYIGDQWFVRVISLALGNTNIQYKQINYDADNIDNNKLKKNKYYI